MAAARCVLLGLGGRDLVGRQLGDGFRIGLRSDLRHRCRRRTGSCLAGLQLSQQGLPPSLGPLAGISLFPLLCAPAFHDAMSLARGVEKAQ